MTMTTPPTTITASVVRPKILDVRTDVAGVVLEREDEIEATLAAFVSGTGLFLLGEPGTGKSYLSDQIVARIDDVKIFDKLMTSQDALTDLVGPKDLMNYKATGEWRHNTAGFLPWADVFRAKEVFKTSEGNLNALLDAFNERVFKNGDRTEHIPLSVILADSNEIPEPDNERLQAIWDRLQQRIVVKPLSPKGLRAALDLVKATPRKLLTWAEVLEAQREAASIPMSDAAKEAWLDIVSLVRREGVFLSDRRVIEAPKIFRASAYLDGADEVQVEHLELAENICWHQPEQVADVRAKVLSVVSPNLKEAFEVADQVAKYAEKFDEYMGLSPKDRYGPVTEIQAKLKLAKEDVEKLVPRATGGKAKRSVEHTLVQIEALSERIKREAFGF